MRDNMSDGCSTTLRVTERRDLERILDQAVADTIERALTQPGKGVLVTRHDHETFTVELTDLVEAGIIRELDVRS